MARTTKRSRVTYGGISCNGNEQLTELEYPKGYDTLCTSCCYLNWLYGPDDGELLDHIASGHQHLDTPTAIDTYNILDPTKPVQLELNFPAN